MQTRAEDPDGVKFDRRIPLWGVLTVIGVLLVQGVVMWGNQRDIAKDVASVSKAQEGIANDVKQIKQDTQVISIEAVKTSIKIDELQRRVTTLEAAQQAAGRGSK